MSNIKEFIASYCDFLNNESLFKKESEVTYNDDFGETYYVYKNVVIKILMERKIIYFEVRGKSQVRDEWFDLNIIDSYLKNSKKFELNYVYEEIKNPYDLDEQRKRIVSESSYLEKNIDFINKIFSKDKIEITEKTLSRYLSLRAKKWFG